MGCWNGTCGISNLPILSGEKVLLFVLEGNKYEDSMGGGFCYTTDRYRPVGVPIHGAYNDYGGIENITKNGEDMFELLSAKNYEMAERKRGKEEGDKPEDIEELINDYIERGLYKNVSFMMVREDILNGLKEFRSKKIQDYKKQFVDFSTTYQEEAKKYVMKSPESIAEIGDFDMNEAREFLDMMIEGSTANIMGYGNVFSSLLRDYNFDSLKKFVILAAKSGKEEHRDAVIDLLFTQLSLGDLRMFWTAQCGAGSQDHEHDLHVALSKTVIDVCSKIDEERKAYWGE